MKEPKVNFVLKGLRDSIEEKLNVSCDQQSFLECGRILEVMEDLSVLWDGGFQWVEAAKGLIEDRKQEQG